MSLTAVALSQLILKARFSHLGLSGHDSFLPILSRVLSDPLCWIAAALVVGGAACWYLAMIGLPLSFMLPTAGIVAPIVSLGAYLLLGESLTPAKLAAILVIASGVAWLGWLNS